jgi:hypothetical protein
MDKKVYGTENERCSASLFSEQKKKHRDPATPPDGGQHDHGCVIGTPAGGAVRSFWQGRLAQKGAPTIIVLAAAGRRAGDTNQWQKRKDACLESI